MKIIEVIKNIGIIIAFLMLIGFMLGTIGILMLCVLFGNILGFITIGFFDLLLILGIYLYCKEEKEWN